MLPRKIPKTAKRSSRWRSQALTMDLARRLLTCADGLLFWKPREREMFDDDRSFRTWNSRFAGKEAFTARQSEGYRVGTIFGRRHFAHRIIWLMNFDAPYGEIDHINGDRADNRLENLRLVSRAENSRNVKRPVTNKSGVVGVYARGGKWGASIQCDKRLHSLGMFATFEQAVSARKAAERALEFHPNHGRG